MGHRPDRQHRASTQPARLAVLLCCAGLLVLPAGCATGPEPVRRPSLGKDPCADRLHDLLGRLLLYYSRHQRFPPGLAALASAGGPALPPLVCPESGQPYVYDPGGARIPGRPGRLILYDPQPSHSGLRWAVLVADSADPAASITAGVILVAEKDIAAAAAKR